MTRLPASWQTKQLIIQDGIPEDIPHLMTLFNASSHLEPWDPTFKIYPEETFIELVEKSVAGGMGNGRFQLQAIRQNEQMIGYFHCFHHNPHPNTLFISMFVLHPDYQKSGFGTEFVQGLARLVKAGGYEAIWLAIFLKNWPALRFWIKSGFTTIIDIKGAPEHDANSHASIVVAKIL